VADEKKIVPVGISWVSNPRGADGSRTAQCGFAFIEDGSSGKSNARNLARLALGYALEDLRIDSLHGVQVIDNFAARNFAMRLGFKDVATVPDYHSIDGKLVAARVMMLRKADFWPNFVSWKESQPKVS
jgi:RimJ/RimL family protein N-acetyltransferase